MTDSNSPSDDERPQRRQYVRVRDLLAVFVQILGEDELDEAALEVARLRRKQAALPSNVDRRHFVQVDTCDISGGGMLVAAAKPIEPETIVRVSMLVGPDGPAKPVHLLARVVRTERAFPPDAKHPWRVAIHFEDIEDEDRETIVKHVIATQRLSVRRVIDRRSANGRAACCFGFYRIDAKRIGGPSKK